MRSALRVLVCAVVAATAALVPWKARGDDAAQWCRNGYFPSETSIAFMQVTGADRAYLRQDNGANASCPDADVCRHGYLLPGQSVLTGKTLGRFICAYYPDSDVAGWIEARVLTPLPVAPQGWVGRWIAHGGAATITIAQQGAGLVVDGEAAWPGAAAADHFGAFAAALAPANGAALVQDGDCRVTLRLVGPYLVANDNSQCGGANVRFDSVYTRTP